MKAIAGINFTVRLVRDTTLDLVDHLDRQPELLDRFAPPSVYAAYHSLKIVVNFEHVIPKADNLFQELHCSLEYFRRRWGVGDHLLKKIERCRSAGGGQCALEEGI
jgi:hypothetical protein